MKKIRTFSASLFQKWEIYQLMADLLQLINTKGSEGLKTFVKTLLESTQTSFEKYDDALEAEKKAEAPAQYDEKRDWGIRELWAIVSVYTDHFLVPGQQNAALFFEKIFNKYGSGNAIAQTGRDKQSGILANLLQDIKTEAATPHTAALNLQPLIAYIEENNNAYINARRELTEENLQLAGLTKDTRTVLENDWRNLSTAINGFAMVNQTDTEFINLIDNINATIERYIAAARRRRSTKPDETPETPENGGDE